MDGILVGEACEAQGMVLDRALYLHQWPRQSGMPFPRSLNDIPGVETCDGRDNDAMEWSMTAWYGTTGFIRLPIGR